MIPQGACDLGHERHPQAPSWAEESVEAQRRRNRSRIINNVNAAGPAAYMMISVRILRVSHSH